MAIVFVLRKWRYYLLGRHLVVRTDQRSLKFLLKQRIVNEGNKKWSNKLLGFNFHIGYHFGLENKLVDTLSRIYLALNFSSLSIPKVLQLDEIIKECLQTVKWVSWFQIYNQEMPPRQVACYLMAYFF